MIYLTSAITFIRSTRWAQFALAGGVGLLLALAFRWWLSDQRKDAATSAVKIERQEQAAEIINRVEKANDTRSQIADPASRARYDECLRSARNPENCQRLMP